MASILIVGAGISGLWQAITLAGRGHAVRLIDKAADPFAHSASGMAGAMIAPYCESEGADPIVAELGAASLDLWRAAYPDLEANGSLVVAAPRDQAELERFARMTSHFERVDVKRISALEPAFAGRYGNGLFYADEAHVEPARAMPALLKRARDLGVAVELGASWDHSLPPDYDHVVDCRGMSASGELPGLRGVRGEMLVIETDEISLSRPVRLLHPRFPLYVVPWSRNRFMIGATVIESEDRGPATVRSALDLLGHAYTLHPAFGEARIAGFKAGLRPAFPENVPKIIARGRLFLVNGFYRHGYLLAPVLAGLLGDYIEGKQIRQDVIVDDHSEWRAEADRR
jgi:glycine oxidase